MQRAVECVRIGVEDFLGAGEIISHLQDQELDEMAQAAVMAIQNPKLVDQAVKNSRSAMNLRKLGFGEDVDFCLQRDKSNLVPEFKDGLIRILE